MVDTIDGWTKESDLKLSSYMTRQFVFREEFPGVKSTFVIKPWLPPHSPGQSRYMFLIIVTTAPGKIEARNAIRTTWGQKAWATGNPVIFSLGNFFSR